MFNSFLVENELNPMPLLEHHVPEQYPDLIVPKTQNA
jgi:hypothetical protein